MEDCAASEDDEPAASSPSTSKTLAYARTRGASVSSATSAPFAAPGGAMSEGNEPVSAVSQAKKRRMILDSDDDE